MMASSPIIAPTLACAAVRVADQSRAGLLVVNPAYQLERIWLESVARHQESSSFILSCPARSCKG